MILTYHKIAWSVKDEITTDWLSFLRQMFRLRKKKVLYLDDYDPADESHVILTFDDGYKSIVTWALPVLRWFRYPFEVFVVADFFYGAENGAKQWCHSDDLRKIVRCGGRLQYHSKSHPRLDEINSVEELEKEIQIPDDIKRLDDNGFHWFAYPFWRWNEKVVDVVKKYYQGARSGNGFAEVGNNYALDSIKMDKNIPMEILS